MHNNEGVECLPLAMERSKSFDVAADAADAADDDDAALADDDDSIAVVLLSLPSVVAVVGDLALPIYS
jgi:hypothetical protein